MKRVRKDIEIARQATFYYASCCGSRMRDTMEASHLVNH